MGLNAPDRGPDNRIVVERHSPIFFTFVAAVVVVGPDDLRAPFAPEEFKLAAFLAPEQSVFYLPNISMMPLSFPIISMISAKVFVRKNLDDMVSCDRQEKHEFGPGWRIFSV